MTQNLDLTNFPLFKKAPNSFYNKIISHLKLVTYHPQSYIIKKGDDSKSMYWILKGTVLITSSDGESIYSELSSGQFFGEIGILFNRPRTANVIARTKVLVGVLTSKDFNIVLRYFPLMERRIRDEAQERLAMLDKKTKQQPSQPVIPPLTPAASLTTASNESMPHDKVDATVSINSFIKNLPIFQNLPSNIIHKLCLGVEPLTFKPFQYIFYENDMGSNIYFIVSGQVEVVKFNSENNTEQPIARLNNSNYFGEMSFLSWISNKPNFKRSASIRSITNVDLIVIRSNLLKDLCIEYPFLIDHMRFTSEFRNNENEHLGNFEAREDDEKVDFKGFEFKFDFKPFHSRSVSPIPPSAIADKVDRSSDKKEKSKPKAINHSPTQMLVPLSIKPKRPNPRRSISLNLTPSLNATQSLNQFSSVEPEIVYMPVNKRLKLNDSKLRRRSSILSHNGALTDSILLRIFEFLDLPTLMKMRLINRRWRQLLYLSPTLFQTLDLTPWNTSVDDKSLMEIVKFVGSRPKSINISNCFHITDEGFSYMVNEIGISGKIRSIKMSSNWEIGAMAIMDLTVPSVGKNLEEIDLSNCRKVRDNVVERLIGWTEKVPSQTPEEVHYDNDFDDYEGIGCKKLTKINLGYCKHLTDRVMYHIGEYCNDRLTALDLTRCTTITDKGFEYWTYKYFPKLTTLSLKDCTFLTDKSIISIANSLPNLENLNLNFCCSLTDISIEVLCIGCQNLKSLDLSFCGSAVSDSSLLTVSLSLHSLTSLTLKGCIRVTRAGIDSLLSSNSLLSYLNVSQCKNSNVYPGSIPAQKFNVNPETRSAFVTAGNSNKIIEIVT
ncbi:hypothetical protein CANTEDRAFT_103764 [Yamadazyma tenuis ATCC 10573]|uniref:RNI-like protein n=2 Tax=Candida tenuis TaxID=2315449 RepID=G3B284_CANTC|nr:uncharacterized protein CANTEDRAFT_103764 [Yamadazyma tenuis ATCC 10573]EGV64614.1 hypothetical protein CANTEDRAFT_103764 [Yamadazyma tenuis ATCC 10573]